MSVRSQSNLVYNGSFEEWGSGWIGGSLSIYGDQGAADGRIHIGVNSYLQQDLQTVPGRDYVLSLAAHKTHGPAVFWDGVALSGLTNFGSVGFFWDYRYCYLRATSNVTRLMFDGQNGVMDDVRVYWVQDPIRVVSQPQSRSAFEGGTAGFVTKADGVQPLRYQWFFKDTPIAGATNNSFTASQLRQSHAGNYVVVISNQWNFATSEVAQLQVLVPPTSPEIVVQPTGDFCPVGYGFNLVVAAVGEAPLQYQWWRDGSPLNGATNSVLTFSSVQAGNAGTYSVIVSNGLGTVASLPAVLGTTNIPGGPTVEYDTITNNAAIYDVDGTTRLNSNFLAQICVGATPGILRPVTDAIEFRRGQVTGFLRGTTRPLPDVPAGQTAYLQIRAWERVAGSTYEQARANGGKYGFSPIVPTLVFPFGTRLEAKGFSLRVGQPFFVAGQLGIAEPQPGQPIQFTLTGEVNARYLIEKREPPNNWSPFLILTNTSGTSIFSDPAQTNSGVQLYRARILD